MLGCRGRWLISAVLLAAVLGHASAIKTRFDNYRVYRVRPGTQAQIHALRAVQDNPDGLSFWTSVSNTDSSVDVMVPPYKDSEFASLVDELQLEHNVFIEDLQKLIDNEQPESQDVVTEFSWDRYHRIDQIYDWLRSVVNKYPTIASIVNAGKSFEGRDILGVKISHKTGNPGVFVESGIHAREWIAPAVATYIINELLSSTAAEVQEIAENFDWYIFPSVNPDGYEYTHTQNRMWRKTRSQGRLMCHGADANRNWGFHWRDGGASGNPCLETFAGTAAFSEVETRRLADYVANISHTVQIYVSVHSYGQMLLTPYGVQGVRPQNFQTLLEIGNKSAESLAKRFGTRYTVGNIVDVLYVASGSSVDWVVGTLGVPYAFVYELRDNGQYSFLLPADQIVDTAQETLDSFVTLVTEARKTF